MKLSLQSQGTMPEDAIRCKEAAARNPQGATRTPQGSHHNATCHQEDPLGRHLPPGSPQDPTCCQDATCLDNPMAPIWDCQDAVRYLDAARNSQESHQDTEGHLGLPEHLREAARTPPATRKTPRKQTLPGSMDWFPKKYLFWLNDCFNRWIVLYQSVNSAHCFTY